MSTNEWIFDRAPDSGAKKGGLANAQIFPHGIDYFVREVLQNSKDQGLDGHRVDVRFTLREISGPALDALLEAVGWEQLQEHLDATAVPQLVTIGPRLRGGLNLVKGGSMRVLCIEDSHTHGLKGSEDDEDNFASLVRHELITGAARKDSGGAFGLGKSVLWRFSDLSTVLFHSFVEEDQDNRLIGRTVLAGHEAEGEEWEGSGWFGKPDPGGKRRAVSVWGEDARTTADNLGFGRDPEVGGTSILILGFDDPGEPDEPSIEETCRRIQAAANLWFWPAILAKEMCVRVAGYNGSNEVFPLSSALAVSDEVAPFVAAQQDEPVSGDEVEEPGDVMTHEISVTVPGQQSAIFAKPRPQTIASAMLRVRLAHSGETNRRDMVALQRGTGMVVDYRPMRVGAGNDRGFHAVLRAGLAHGNTDSDHALEEFLRAAEPPAHQDWTYKTERIKAGFHSGYKKALDSLFAAIDQAVRDLTREEPIESDEAPDALRKLFPLKGYGETIHTETYRLKHAQGLRAGDVWIFKGTFQRKPADEAAAKEPWQFTVSLKVDQEGAGRTPTLVRIHDISVDGSAVCSPVDKDGAVTVQVPAGTSEVAFSGDSEKVDELPPGGVSRVRLRMDIKGAMAAGATT